MQNYYTVASAKLATIEKLIEEAFKKMEMPHEMKIAELTQLQFARFCITLILMLTPTVCSYAQQNLFNIPSGDITNHKKVFYQHQINVYGKKVESKSHFVYGLGKGWDAGVNLVGKGIYFTPQWRALYNDNTSNGSLYPILMGTIQKQFMLTKKIFVNIGGQYGWNLSNKISNKKFNHFTYLLGRYNFLKGSRVVGGVYKTTNMFTGEGNTSGIIAGYEVKIAKRWYLMGDWVSGNNDAAVLVLGGMVNVSKRVQICSGWQIPNPQTPKPKAIVLELNLLGWDLY